MPPIVAGGFVICAIAIPLILVLFGFGPGGVAAGSLAAGIQSGIGNVAAGSIFAIMQSVGTMPLVTALYGGLFGVVVVGAGLGVVALVKHPEIITAVVHWIEEMAKAGVIWIPETIKAGVHWIGEMAKAGVLWIPEMIKTGVLWIPEMIKAGVHWIGEMIKSAFGMVDFDTLGHQTSQSTGIIASSAQNALAGMVKAMGGLPASDAATQGVASAIEALNVTSTAHQAVENIVGDMKNAFGDALWKIASGIRG